MIIEPVANNSSIGRMHWTRIALVTGALLVVISTFLPWLVGVPPNVLEIGSGTIRGITTVHGMIALGAGIAIIVLALLQPRHQRPHRGILAAVLGIAVVTLGLSSLVLGTGKKEIYDEIDRAAPSADVANAAVVAMANKLHDFGTGSGAIVIALGCGLLVLTALIAMFVKRPR